MDRCGGVQVIPRYAARRDTTEPEIILALEQMGFHVEQVSAPGIPDLILSRGGQFYLAEVKTGKGRLTKAQSVFHAAHRAQIPILRTVEQAIEWARRLDR